jgi:hypothetical protein
MRWYHLLTGVMCLGVLAAVGLLIAGEPQSQSPQYLKDDVQYFPVGPQHKLPGRAIDVRDAALGDLLFTDVVSVHFIGPGHPANSDGTLGGLVAGDDGTQMKIYQRFIVMEAADSEGRTYRTLHAYETLGKIEQRLARRKDGAKH